MGSRRYLAESPPRGNDSEAEYTDADTLIADQEAGIVTPLAELLDSLPTPVSNKGR